MHLFILLISGCFVGIASGVLGIGGAVLIVPLLTLVMGYPHKTAVGTSLAMLQMPVGILAVMNYYKSNHVDLRTTFLLAIGYIGGAYLGSQIALSDTVPQSTLQRIFALFLFYVAGNMLLKTDDHAWAAIQSLIFVGIAWVMFSGSRLLGAKWSTPITAKQAFAARIEKPIERDYEI